MLQIHLHSLHFLTTRSSSFLNKHSFKNTLDQKTKLPSKLSNKTVKFKTLKSCKLGISRFPDFEYNAEGGNGTGGGGAVKVGGGVDEEEGEEWFVEFDVAALYIPPLTAATTKFLGLPLPPFLRIDIMPELFRGNINSVTGKVDLEFKSKFWFSVGALYRAPPLTVETVLTTEESRGTIRNGNGERMDELGRCKLVGVATVQPVNDFFMNSFLSLPTECLASLNVIISWES